MPDERPYSVVLWRRPLGMPEIFLRALGPFATFDEAQACDESLALPDRVRSTIEPLHDPETEVWRAVE